MTSIPPGFARVQVLLELVGGHDCISTWDYEVSAPPTSTDVFNLSAQVAPAWKAQLNSGSLYKGLKVFVGQDGDPILLETTNQAGVGGRGSALAAPQCQGLINKKTGLAGRRQRGRSFIPNMIESQVGDLGDVDSTGKGLIQAIADIMFGGNTPFDTLVLLHSDGSTPTEVTSVVASGKVATLRRRYER